MITSYKDTLENFINCLTKEDILIELYNFTSQTFGEEIDTDGEYLSELLYRTNENPLDRMIKILTTLVEHNIYNIQHKIHSELKSGQLLTNSTTLNEIINNIVDNYDYRYTLESINVYEDTKMSYEKQYAKQKMLGDDIYSPNEDVLVTVEFNKYNDLVVNIYAKELVFPIILDSDFGRDSLISLYDSLDSNGIENSLNYIDDDYFTYNEHTLNIFSDGTEVNYKEIESKIRKQTNLMNGAIEEKVVTLIKNDLHIDTLEKLEWFIRELIKNIIKTVDDVQLILNKIPDSKELEKQAIENQKQFIKKELSHIIESMDTNTIAFRAGIKDKSLIKVALNIRNNKKDILNNIVGLSNFQATAVRRVNVVPGKSRKYRLFESKSKHYIEFPALSAEVSKEAETSYVTTLYIERVYPKALYEALIETLEEIKGNDYNIAIIVENREAKDRTALEKVIYEVYGKE